MTNTILQTNATPIYAFLSFITAKQSQGELGNRIKILDCGAGGSVPPLVAFREQGFETYGIDISDQQLARAQQYCERQGSHVDFRKADMRQIPFRTESFECVYEHYAMCHLSKSETATAIGEMQRVTKRKGLCFLGFISLDSWPKSLYGEEREPGEYWMGDDRHTMFTDQEADELVKDWEILTKEKRVIYNRMAAKQISKETWSEMYAGEGTAYTKDDWHSLYAQRVNLVNYTQIYYILRRP